MCIEIEPFLLFVKNIGTFYRKTVQIKIIVAKRCGGRIKYRRVVDIND